MSAIVKDNLAPPIDFERLCMRARAWAATFRVTAKPIIGIGDFYAKDGESDPERYVWEPAPLEISSTLAVAMMEWLAERADERARTWKRQREKREARARLIAAAKARRAARTQQEGAR